MFYVRNGIVNCGEIQSLRSEKEVGKCSNLVCLSNPSLTSLSQTNSKGMVSYKLNLFIGLQH